MRKLDHRKVASGIFEQHGLMHHGQLRCVADCRSECARFPRSRPSRGDESEPGRDPQPTAETA